MNLGAFLGRFLKCSSQFAIRSSCLGSFNFALELLSLFTLCLAYYDCLSGIKSLI